MLQTLEMSSCFAFQSTAINITQAHATPFHKKRHNKQAASSPIAGNFSF